MLPEHFYFTGAGLLGYLLYAPLVVFLLILFHRYLLRRFMGPAPRWGLSLILSVVLLSLPFWDVLAIGYEADKLCKEQGGLHVYKTVEAEGFLGSSGIKYWSKYGFKYVEDGGTRDRKFRITLVKGKPKYEQISVYTSRYQSRGGKYEAISRHFGRFRYFVQNRQTGEVLGDLVYFSISPGWFDHLFLGLLPVEFNPWICGWEAPLGEGEYSPAHGKRLYSYRDLVRATIKPRHRRENQ